MFIDLWVASDGCTTIRFPDEQSALLYCAQTGWSPTDLLIVRTQVRQESESLTVEPWNHLMHPELDENNSGTWLDNVWLPDPNLPANDSENYTSEYIGKLAYTSAVTGWEFRDLAASVPEMIEAAFEFATAASEKEEEVTWQQAMDYVFTKTGKKRIID